MDLLSGQLLGRTKIYKEGTDGKLGIPLFFSISTHADPELSLSR